MKHPKGLIPIVVVIFITIIAASIVGMAWYYNEHKDEVATSTANTNDSWVLDCSAITDESTCHSRADCYSIFDSCPCYTKNSKATKCNDTLLQCEKCDDDSFSRCVTLSCDSTNTNTSTTNTSDWQTYTNEELGISFEYPSVGNVSVTEFNSTQSKDENLYPTTGKAVSISVSFSDKSKIYLIGSSSDYSRIYSESYNGGDDLAAVCSNPGVIENESYCYNTTVADQDTYKKVYFQAPECSPVFVEESKLNLNKNGYAGLRIHQLFFTNGDWDCTSPTEEFNAITNSEIQRFFSGAELTEEEQEKFENFDRFLSSIQLTSQ